jgi:hypothetical protein
MTSTEKARFLAIWQEGLETGEITTRLNISGG